jgi:hypothetical protein
MLRRLERKDHAEFDDKEIKHQVIIRIVVSNHRFYSAGMNHTLIADLGFGMGMRSPYRFLHMFCVQKKQVFGAGMKIVSRRRRIHFWNEPKVITFMPGLRFYSLIHIPLVLTFVNHHHHRLPAYGVARQSTPSIDGGIRLQWPSTRRIE